MREMSGRGVIFLLFETVISHPLSDDGSVGYFGGDRAETGSMGAIETV